LSRVVKIESWESALDMEDSVHGNNKAIRSAETTICHQQYRKVVSMYCVYVYFHLNLIFDLSKTWRIILKASMFTKHVSSMLGKKRVIMKTWFLCRIKILLIIF